jgi:hypothetical protein
MCPDGRVGSLAWQPPGQADGSVATGPPLRRAAARSVGYGSDAPEAEICFDPCHVVAPRSAPLTRSAATNGTPTTARTRRPVGGSKNTRWSLLKSPEKQSVRELARVAEALDANEPMHQSFLLKEELRLLYQIEDPAPPPAHLDAWPSRSRLDPLVKLARTIRRHRIGLSNARPEGLNSRIRLIGTAASASHSTEPLIPLIYLCASSVIPLPRRLHRQYDRSTGIVLCPWHRRSCAGSGRTLCCDHHCVSRRSANSTAQPGDRATAMSPTQNGISKSPIGRLAQR